jgi:hypothetical protein
MEFEKIYSFNHVSSESEPKCHSCNQIHQPPDRLGVLIGMNEYGTAHMPISNEYTQGDLDKLASR